MAYADYELLRIEVTKLDHAAGFSRARRGSVSIPARCFDLVVDGCDVLHSL